MRSVLWRGPDGSLERCTLLESRAGVRLAGTVLRPMTGIPLEVRYVIDLDRKFTTLRAEVRVADGASLVLESDGRGRWTSDGRDLRFADGCRDVDLEVSPATNTLPIRRLHPKVGETVTPQGLWVRFPSLSLEVIDQSYERVSETEWRYSSGSFNADLECYPDGLVRRYGDLWAVEAEAS
jgi:uncharacterized protein